jgi:hypothetical protein
LLQQLAIGLHWQFVVANAGMQLMDGSVEAKIRVVFSRLSVHGRYGYGCLDGVPQTGGGDPVGDLHSGLIDLDTALSASQRSPETGPLDASLVIHVNGFAFDLSIFNDLQYVAEGLGGRIDGHNEALV